jgi:hypothetical protein
VSLSLNQIAGRVWGAGLVGSGLQFFTRLAAVFAEENGGFRFDYFVANHTANNRADT